MTRRAHDILGLGSVAVDDFLYVPAFPQQEIKMQVQERARQCGGLTATALVAAARLGARCAYAGVLGRDADSQFVFDTFAREGIDTQHIIRNDKARPIHSTIIVEAERQTRTILYDLKGSVGARPDAPAEEVIRAAGVLFVDHYGIEGMIRAAKIARAAGVPVVADLERNDWPGFSDLLALVDHLIVSRAFAKRVTGQDQPAAGCAALWTEARQVVIVTDGEHGCWYQYGQERPRHWPAFAVQAADTTGCGDVFHGAYAAKLASGAGLEDRLRFASAAAALKATRTGGQVGIPTRSEVEEFLQARAGNQARGGRQPPGPGSLQ
ncbi:MAG: PfkB family carbohydrate kinase [Gemmataceae bacterium]